MSFNLNNKVNNLTTLVNSLIVGNSDISCNNLTATSITAKTGGALSINADALLGVVVNTKMTIPNHTLVITNNTANDSFRVEDSGADTSTFRIDNDGNVAIKGNPATTLTNALNVNGNTVLTGTLNVSSTASITGQTTQTGALICSNGVRSTQAIDIANANYTFDTSAKLQRLHQGLIYSSIPVSAPRTITFPSASVLHAEFGVNSIVRFNLNIGFDATTNVITLQGGTNCAFGASGGAYLLTYVLIDATYDLVMVNIIDTGVPRTFIGLIQLGSL